MFPTLRWVILWQYIQCTSKSLSEAFILTSTNPQYDNRLFIDLPVQYVKTTSSENGENMLCTQIVFSFLLMFSELVVFMYWTSESMNNLLSYCGLVDQRISVTDKDLPVHLPPDAKFFFSWSFSGPFNTTTNVSYCLTWSGILCSIQLILQYFLLFPLFILGKTIDCWQDKQHSQVQSYQYKIPSDGVPIV